MIDFGTWSLKQAEEYCASYAKGVALRAEWLGREVAATSDLDTTALTGEAGLMELWRWFGHRLTTEGPTRLTLRTPLPDDDPQHGQRPPWQAPNKTNPYLSDGALWLIEGIGCHLAMVAMDNCPEAEWEVYRAPKRRKDFNQHRTQLFGVPGGPAEPSRMVYGDVIGPVIHNEDWRDDALVRLYHYLVDPK